jgi:hypothetical protein
MDVTLIKTRAPAFKEPVDSALETFPASGAHFTLPDPIWPSSSELYLLATGFRMV